jgi:hypothetical protein
MSAQGNPQPLVPSFTITGNSAIDGIIFKVVSGLAFAAAAWLVKDFKLTDPSATSEIAGAIIAVAGAIGVMIVGYIKSRRDKAVAVQSGINLVVSGQALDTRGNIISSITPNSTPPLPVSLQSADQIVKDFAPAKAT